MTTTRSDYEQSILREISDLPESELPKILKMLHSLKEEILQIESPKGKDLEMFLDSFGSWQDERSSEEIIRDIRESRKSTGRNIQL
jgi:CDP-glycerol glycerophosphotransferase (TagB/SpsB family)